MHVFKNAQVIFLFTSKTIIVIFYNLNRFPYREDHIFY